MIFEGLATKWNDAVKLIREGDGIEFSSNHDREAGTYGSECIRPRCPSLVVKDRK